MTTIRITVRAAAGGKSITLRARLVSTEHGDSALYLNPRQLARVRSINPPYSLVDALDVHAGYEPWTGVYGGGAQAVRSEDMRAWERRKAGGQ